MMKHGNRMGRSLVIVCTVVLLCATTAPCRAIADSSTLQGQAAATGIIVFDPVVEDQSKEAATFGTGCTRWLQHVLNGCPALKAPPRWEALHRLQTEQKLPDFRAQQKDAPALGKLIGASHVVTGTLTGAGDALQLTLKVSAVSSGVLAPTSAQASGSRSQIVEKLPDIAKQILTAVKVEIVDVPAKCELDDADLSFIGGLDRVSKSVLPGVDQARLNALVSRSSIAIYNLTDGGSRSYNDVELVQMMSGLAQRSKRSPVVLSTCARNVLMPADDVIKSVEALLTAYPDNALLLEARSFLLGRKGNFAAAENVATALTRNTPGDPDAWLRLAAALSGHASEIRKGRTVDKISEEEWGTLRPLYARWMQACERAVACDPLFAKAWARLAMAATFAGSEERAKQALNKALSLDQSNADALEWGLEMYEPKWFDDEKEQQKIALQASQGRSAAWDTELILAERLMQVGYEDLARASATRIHTEAAGRFGVDSGKGVNAIFARVSAAMALRLLKRDSEAVSVFADASAMAPQCAYIRLHYGRCLKSLGRVEEARAQWQAALALPEGPNTKALRAALSAN